MTESELREHVAKKLRRDEVPEELWQDLVDRRFIQGVLQGDESISDVVKEVKRELRLAQQLAKRSTPPGRKVNVVARPFLQAHERARAQALAEWLGHHVATLPRVRHLREKLFGGMTLSTEQAKTLLKSPALCLLSWAQCKDLGIPLIDHEARILKKEDKITSTHRSIDVTLHIAWIDGAYDGACHWEEEHHGRGTRLEHIMLPRLQNARLVEVWPESVLEELHKCSAWLAWRYLWEESDAFWFVLTGEYPCVSPVDLRVSMRKHGDLHRHRIILSVDPWVSAKTIWRAYRAAQDSVLSGRDNRPLRNRSLALVPFVASKLDPHGKKPPLKNLMEVWNRTYPAWSYERVTTFGRDVDRAEVVLLFSAYDGMENLPKSVEIVGERRIPLTEEPNSHSKQRQTDSTG